jgi:hypothetical protein
MKIFTIFEKLYCLFMVFFSGFIVACNLTVLVYEVPNVYEAAWWKVTLGLIIGLVHGLVVAFKRPT